MHTRPRRPQLPQVLLRNRPPRFPSTLRAQPACSAILATHYLASAILGSSQEGEQRLEAG